MTVKPPIKYTPQRTSHYKGLNGWSQGVHYWLRGCTMINKSLQSYLELNLLPGMKAVLVKWVILLLVAWAFSTHNIYILCSRTSGQGSILGYCQLATSGPKPCVPEAAKTLCPCGSQNLVSMWQPKPWWRLHTVHILFLPSVTRCCSFCPPLTWHKRKMRGMRKPGRRRTTRCFVSVCGKDAASAKPWQPKKPSLNCNHYSGRAANVIHTPCIINFDDDPLHISMWAYWWQLTYKKIWEV